MISELITLTPDELREITGYKIASKQMEALTYMGIPFRARPDGTPCVLRSALVAATSTDGKARMQPKLNAI